MANPQEDGQVMSENKGENVVELQGDSVLETGVMQAKVIM